ncbi:MAG: DNA ligase [Gammaproteobacteria bacterium]
MTRCTKYAFVVLAVICCALPVAFADGKPDLMLARAYDERIDVSQYWVSEKLDGVRARWSGQKMVSRGGVTFAAPVWFTEGFPTIFLDGELWIARARYEETVSIVRKQKPHAGWRQVKFMVFDLPEHGGSFDERVSAMREIGARNTSPYLRIVEQFRVTAHEHLMQRLRDVVANGGEGLMLHRREARYLVGRSNDLLKLKLFDDAEAVVLGYRPGKGRYKGMTGSLRVRDERGNIFHIGSGLSDAQRHNPPAVGTRITFRYQGLTRNGIPRFPVFLRVRGHLLE